jgi:hypothetical protein
MFIPSAAQDELDENNHKTYPRYETVVWMDTIK